VAAKKKAEEDKRVQLEEQKRKQQEDIKIRLEEQRKKQQEMIQSKVEAEQKKKFEQQAALSVRRVIHKLRLATPTNFDELKAELAKVQEECKDKLGSQAEKIQEEINQITELAQKKIDVINEAKRKEDERKQKEEDARKAVEQHIEGLLQELNTVIEKAEGLNTKLQESMAAFVEGEKGMQVEAAEAAVNDLMRLGEEAVAAAKECSSFVQKNGAEMKKQIPRPIQPGKPPVVNDTLERQKKTSHDVGAY
jgi:chromosome segregation ATPase